VFALCDEEEQGKIGSLFYAGGMAANDAEIKAVINMDAIAYDGNADKKARIHARPVANSLEIADTVFAMRDQFSIDLDLILTNPGATYSDHASFWTEGYGAVLVIEEFSADGNPYYHTPNDRIQYFDVPYYEKLAKLSVAATAALAIPVDDETAVAGQQGKGRLLVFPNPTAGDLTVYLDASFTGAATVHLHDAMGKPVGIAETTMLTGDRSSFQLSLSTVAPGAYSISIALANGQRREARIVKLP
jgi:Zn-dependent M28 family amino/carboxypeptidase